MNFQQKIAVAVMDVLMLGELCFAMYLAHNNPENFTSVFCKTFFGMFILTLFVTIFVVRRLRTSEAPVES